MRTPRSAFVARAFCRPEILLRAVLKKLSLGSLEFRLAFEAIDRPWYARGIYEAACLAQSLKEPAISVIEFGVAQGNGLVAMEKLASEIGKHLGVLIHTFGFDSGEGMPSSGDYRDLPYVWQRGLYKMDVEALRARLATTRLIL